MLGLHMNEFEQRKKEVLQPIFFEAGAALYDCQAFDIQQLKVR